MKIYEANGNRFLIDRKMIDVKKCCKETKSDGFLFIHSHSMIIFNADGSKASLCVNGLHCFTHFLFDENKEYTLYALLIGNEIYKCEIVQKEPFISTVEIKKPKIFRNFVDVGNEHMILLNEQIDDASRLSKRYACNVNYVKIINQQYIEVKTYEKGVGFTKSCGSGNIASSYYCLSNDLVDDCIQVLNEGGVCEIKMHENILIQTPSQYVGEYEYNQ